MTETRAGRLNEMLVFCAILLIAGFLRLYRLDQLPPGLHYDEAFKGVEARNVIAGPERPIFFAENIGEDPMRIYATAADFVLFGDSPWSLRLASAFAGILTVAATYALARDLLRSRWLAALAAFTLAILYWQVNFSRLGMEPILTPLMMTLTFAFFWRGWRSGARAPPVGRPITSCEAVSHLHCTKRSAVQVLRGAQFATKQSQPMTEIASPPAGARNDRYARLYRLNTSRWWRPSAGWFALAGVCLGATGYTYQAAAFVVVFTAAFVAIELVVARAAWTRHRFHLVLFAVAATVTFAPLGWYLISNSGQLFERPSEVMATSSGLAPLADNVIRVAGMFFVRGDENPRSNLPLRPALDPFLAIGFLAGLVVCTIRIRRAESRFLLLWLSVMALPTVLTSFAPHFGRSIGVTPALAIIVAAGFGWLVTKLPSPRPFLVTILLIGLATSMYSTVHDYFDVWGTGTGLFDSFDVGYLSLAQQLKERPAGEAVYVTPVGTDNYTIRYGLAGREARSFDGRHVLVLPPPGTTADYGIVTREDARTLARLKKIFPSGNVAGTVGDFTGRPAAVVFRSAGVPQISPQGAVHARVGDAFELIGYDVAREEGALSLSVYWQSIAETREDYTVFVHLVGAMNAATQSPVWAQDDAAPGHGSFPTSRWRQGEIVVDEYRLLVPEGAPRGVYGIELGMYTVKTGERLKLADADGAPVENDRILVEGIQVP